MGRSVSDIAAKLQSVGHLALVLALTSSLSACNQLPDILNFGKSAVQQASDAIDTAEADLNVTSNSWQQVLQQLLSSLNGDAKSLISNDVQTLLDRTVAEAGSEFRCDTDFVNHRVAQDLLAIKAKLLGQTIPVRPPSFCQAVPQAIDLAQVPTQFTYLTFSGYDMDLTSDLHVKLQAADGSETDVDKTLIAVPTSYSMTVNLVKLPITSNSRNLELYYGDQLLSTVGIIAAQAPVKVCQGSTVQLPVVKLGPFIPPKVNNGGDDDFDGNGPNINVSVSLITTPNKVTARLYMDARETKKDWTEVQGTQDFMVYQAQPNQQIASITPSGSSTYSYLDTGFNRTNPTVGFPVQMGGGVAKSMLIVGDTKGNDVGHTQIMEADLTPLTISLNEVGDCTSPFALKSLLGTKFLSPALKAKIAAPGLLESKIAVTKVAAPQVSAH